MGPKLDDQLCYSLYSTSRMVTQAYKPLLQPLNLTYPQYVVMMALWDKKTVTISEIADITGITNATLSPLLKRLENNHYIERRLSQDDERQKSIVLTKEGKALANKAQKSAKQALCATGLNEKEVAKLMRLCAQIRLNLDNL